MLTETRNPSQAQLRPASKPAQGRLGARIIFVRAATEFGPALVLASLLYAQLGDLALALGAGGFALFAAVELRLHRRSSHLIPLGALVAWIAPVAVAGLIVLAVSAGDNNGHPVEVLLAMAGAYAVLAAGGYGLVLFRRHNPLRAAIVGNEQMASALALELVNADRLQSVLVGRIAPDGEGPASHPAVPRIGSISEIRATVLEHDLDVLICAPSGGPGQEDERQSILEAAVACLDLPVRLLDGEEAYESILGHVPLAITGPDWFAPLLDPRRGWSFDSMTRIRDFALILLAAPFVLVLMALCALGVLITDGRPIFHRQRRIGTGGNQFTVYKLRTMYEGVKGDQWWAQEDDPRVTPFGRFLRRSHLDELPQMWNVLRGEMAIVGPRPEVPGIVDELEAEFPYYDRRHLARPGITGWAQVRCGYAGSYSGSAWKLCFDLYYLKNRSFVFDVLIMFETVRVVLIGSQFGLTEPDSRFISGHAASGVDLAAEHAHGHAIASMGQMSRLPSGAMHSPARD